MMAGITKARLASGLMVVSMLPALSMAETERAGSGGPRVVTVRPGGSASVAAQAGNWKALALVTPGASPLRVTVYDACDHPLDWRVLDAEHRTLTHSGIGGGALRVQLTNPGGTLAQVRVER